MKNFWVLSFRNLWVRKTRMALAKAGAMGILGAVFGVAVALPGSFVVGVIIALIVSQIAALHPSWRAGQVSVVKAIQSE